MGALSLDRVFARLPAGTKPGDVVVLLGREYVVETVKVADDLKDAKCVCVVR